MRKNAGNVKIIVVVLGLVVVGAFSWFVISGVLKAGRNLFNKPTAGVDGFRFTTKTDPIMLATLSQRMEADLKLKEVMISEAKGKSGTILEIRLQKPDNVSKEVLSTAAAYIFGYTSPFINSDIRKVRVIYLINHKDSVLYEVSLADILDWKANQISDNEFAKTIKFASLVKH